MHLLYGLYYLLCLHADSSATRTEIVSSVNTAAGYTVTGSVTNGSVAVSVTTTLVTAAAGSVVSSAIVAYETLSTHATSVTSIIDFQKFLSDDPSTVNAVSQAVPPFSALAALEAMLTEHQLQGFRFVYSEDGKLDSNPTYQCWSKLKDLCAQHPASVSQA